MDWVVNAVRGPVRSLGGAKRSTAQLDLQIRKWVLDKYETVITALESLLEGGLSEWRQQISGIISQQCRCPATR
jgi:hypothetical protein